MRRQATESLFWGESVMSYVIPEQGRAAFT